MVQSVAQIVGDHLFDLELIRPHVDGMGIVKLHAGFLLLDQNAGRRYDALYQFHNIEPLHLHRVVAKLQRRQRQQLAHHLVHLVGLVHDDLAVVVTALLLLRHAFRQSFRIALNQRNRRLQLVGHVGDEILSHLVNLNFLLDVVLQLIVGRLQFPDGLL